MQLWRLLVHESITDVCGGVTVMAIVVAVHRMIFDVAVHRGIGKDSINLRGFARDSIIIISLTPASFVSPLPSSSNSRIISILSAHTIIRKRFEQR